jgi:hypothetical protein
MAAVDAVVAGVQTSEPVIPLSLVMGRAFGICAALLIQQIHCLVQISGESYLGEQWCYNTYEGWAQQLGVYAAVANG